jgi:hypothetical protein
MKKILIFFLLLSACATKNQLQKVTELGQQKNFKTKIYHTKNFDIFTLQKISNSKNNLRIYIEGDGFAYIDKSTPSVDPTPNSHFLLNLALADKSKNILYIARPCQFVMNKNCEEKYWTSDRFSKEIIDAVQVVINNFLKQNYEFIGYSGGAGIINHLNHKRTKKIVTIAGNLDLEEFTRIHKISKLVEEKIDYEKLSKIPQLHFVGMKDKVVPLEVFLAYEKKLPKKNFVELRMIEGADHEEGWDVNVDD